MDVLGANLYVSKNGYNPAATDKYVDMLRNYNKPLMITEFGSMSTTADGAAARSPEDIGNPQRYAKILRQGYEPFHRHPEIVGYVPWAIRSLTLL